MADDGSTAKFDKGCLGPGVLIAGCFALAGAGLLAIDEGMLKVLCVAVVFLGPYPLLLFLAPPGRKRIHGRALTPFEQRMNEGVWIALGVHTVVMTGSWVLAGEQIIPSFLAQILVVVSSCAAVVTSLVLLSLASADR